MKESQFFPVVCKLKGVVLFFLSFTGHRDGKGTNCDVSRKVGLALCEAFEEVDKVNKLCILFV